MAKPDEPTLTVAEVAARLRVHYDTVLGWIKVGELTAANYGGPRRAAWRVSEDALKAFSEGRQHRPAPPARTKWSRPRRTSRVREFV